MSRRAVVLAVVVYLWPSSPVSCSITGITKREAKISEAHDKMDPTSNDINPHHDFYEPRNMSQEGPHSKDEGHKDGGHKDEGHKDDPTHKRDPMHFGYSSSDGPGTWGSRFPWCVGRAQSPVDLDTTAATTVHHPHLFWWGYALRPTGIRLMNNGHTVSLQPQWDASDQTPYHWESPGGHEYVLDQMHFHWGPDDDTGSEHTLNGEQFPLELHAVHHWRRFSSKEEAALYPEGLRVVSVLFRLSEHNNTALDDVVAALPDVRIPDTTQQLPPAQLSRLLPPFAKLFLAYNGSLTTPPCAETVSWVVRKEPSFVGTLQLKEFRNLMDHDGQHITTNFRPTQPLNGRQVYHIR